MPPREIKVFIASPGDLAIERLAAYAHINPTGAWSEDWATLYTNTGAGTPLPPDHPRHADRLATDQKILTNLLRLNHQRAHADGIREGKSISTQNHVQRRNECPSS